jgi:hypothetical protein
MRHIQVRLANGISITFKNLVLEGVRFDSVSRAPGAELPLLHPPSLCIRLFVVHTWQPT